MTERAIRNRLRALRADGLIEWGIGRTGARLTAMGRSVRLGCKQPIIALMGLAAWLAWGAPQALAGTAAGWLDWLVGLAAALVVAFVYMTASLLAAQAKVAHNSRQAG